MEVETLLRSTPRDGSPDAARLLGRSLVGAFYLVMGGVHLGMVSADADTNRHFADEGLFPIVRDGWLTIAMARPSVWGLLLMLGEITLGALLLIGPRTAPWGWAGVIAFHVMLLPFGFWLWGYAVPALVILVLLASRDLGRRIP